MSEKKSLRSRDAAIMASVMFISVLIGFLIRASASIALPFISVEYGWSNEQLGIYGGLILSIFLVGYGISNCALQPASGPLWYPPGPDRLEHWMVSDNIDHRPGRIRYSCLPSFLGSF